MNSSPLIDIRALHKSYFSAGLETKVLHDINLAIAEGEFVSIMGPSGSGKSTLMHILGFLDIPTSGQFLFNGQDVSTLSDDALAQIRATAVSFVFQSFNLIPRTSVADNVRLPLMYHPIIKAEGRAKLTENAIASVGLSDRAMYLSNQLSGGQQQRVAIARALVTDPQIIFADEPTGNLDSASGLQVMSILQNLHRQGHTIILVTHEQTTAQFAERVIRLKDGRIESDSKDFERTLANANHALK